jgi:hypothetical protein
MCKNALYGVELCGQGKNCILPGPATRLWVAAWCIKDDILIAYFNSHTNFALGFNGGIRKEW